MKTVKMCGWCGERGAFLASHRLGGKNPVSACRRCIAQYQIDHSDLRAMLREEAQDRQRALRELIALLAAWCAHLWRPAGGLLRMFRRGVRELKYELRRRLRRWVAAAMPLILVAVAASVMMFWVVGFLLYAVGVEGIADAFGNLRFR